MFSLSIVNLLVNLTCLQTEVTDNAISFSAMRDYVGHNR